MLLLFPCQEEALAGQLGDRVDQTDSVVDVVAVKQSDVLVGDQDVLKTDFANVRHLLDVRFVKFVLKSREALRLNRNFFHLRHLIFYHEYEQLFSFKIKQPLVLGMDDEAPLIINFFNKKNFNHASLIDIHDPHKFLIY